MNVKRRKKIVEKVISRDGLECCYCNLQLNKTTITMDHIVPVYLRGTYNSTNLTVACANCNNSRGHKNFFVFAAEKHMSNAKISKYKQLYHNNLTIKILNLAKEKFLINELVCPKELILKAFKELRIKDGKQLLILSEINGLIKLSMDENVERNKIKFSFEQAILNIEAKI